MLHGLAPPFCKVSFQPTVLFCVSVDSYMLYLRHTTAPLLVKTDFSPGLHDSPGEIQDALTLTLEWTIFSKSQGHVKWPGVLVAHGNVQVYNFLLL